MYYDTNMHLNPSLTVIYRFEFIFAIKFFSLETTTAKKFQLHTFSIEI